MKVHYKLDTFEIWGYYPDDFKDVPSPNITITDEAWREAVSSGANKVDKKNKTLFCETKEPSLDELKEQKLAELSRWQKDMTERAKINLKGFGEIDGGYKYLLNAISMIENYDELPQKVFRTFDNSFKPVTLDELKNIKIAIERGGIELFNLKWRYEIAINAATTKDELAAIDFADVIEIDLGEKNE